MYEPKERCIDEKEGKGISDRERARRFNGQLVADYSLENAYPLPTHELMLTVVGR